ncbi:hypothetical protein F4813DRAFT_362618 [Daldinia decipiens]|uniref:uncharacterized protein n=1 Tax=Daldinia decipiens TaxID=326647 RepID=UPI0020C47AD2|nr:uncharacterized protein F4813DRAFT_362618 [Daldinia decipiens]KAI1656634.1 hypothetical protein F4813DRAFT_362618 [Daldinia decipiens]
MLFVADDPSHLNNIFISIQSATVSNIWSEMAVSRLFGPDTIVTPALNQLDPLIDHVDATSLVLPGTVAEMWRQKRAIDFDDSPEWVNYAGEVLGAWVHTAAWFSNEIDGDQFDAFESGKLEHPYGGTYWDWFANRAPNIFPTLVFARLKDDEIIVT